MMIDEKRRTEKKKAAAGLSPLGLQASGQKPGHMYRAEQMHNNKFSQPEEYGQGSLPSAYFKRLSCNNF